MISNNSTVIEEQLSSSSIDVIVWKKEVEVRGLSIDLQKKFETLGAFWVTRGLRMTESLFNKLEKEHSELTFVKRKVKECNSNNG